MATKTLGTAATTTLTAIQWALSGAGLAAADIATILNGILDDQSPAHQPAKQLGVGGMDPGSGAIILPGARGVIYPKPGDFIAIDGTGWPIVLAAAAAASASWVHT